ncbi:hypothetical protein MNEG_15992, partial [Monoraphidium neglectum]
VLWAALALLSSDYVHVFRGAVELASECLARLALQDATVQGVLLASAPIVDPDAENTPNGSGGGRGGEAAALAGLAGDAPGGGGGGAGSWGSAPGSRRG